VLSYTLAITSFLGLSFESRAQAPNSPVKTHTIDKSKLSIHQNFRDEQPQRFSNDKSKIVAFATNTKHNSKTNTPKNIAVHTKGNSATTTQKVSEIKGEKKAALIKAVHHKTKRKIKKSH